MVGKLCILLLVIAAEAQVIFPDEVFTSFTTRRPKPVTINFPEDSNPDPDPPRAPSPPSPSTTQSPRPNHNPPAFPVPDHTPHQGNRCTLCRSVFPPKCGEAKSIRIVGGKISQPGDWPWLAAVGRRSGPVFVNSCGGSLISVRHVLSAEHCFAGPIKPDVVRLGEYDLTRSDDVPDTQDFRIARRHNIGYNRRTYENDIVLIVLDHDVVFSDYIQPICLPFHLRDNEFTDSNLVVAGWGRTDFSEDDSYSKVPQDAQVKMVNRLRCAKSYAVVRGRPGPVVDDRHLCAGDDSTDSCSGDSGGPLQYLSLSDGRYYLVGIVSFGIGCASGEYPGVYTRVSRFLDWIVGNSQ